MKTIALELLRLTLCALVARGVAWVVLAGGKTMTIGQNGLALLLFFAFVALWRDA